MAYGAGGVTCKLSDFGTCIRVPSSQMLTEQMGTSGYTAPEVFDPQAYALPADVFSLAIIMWEVFYSHLHENPFTGLAPEDYVALVRHNAFFTSCSNLLENVRVKGECDRLWMANTESQ